MRARALHRPRAARFAGAALLCAAGLACASGARAQAALGLQPAIGLGGEDLRGNVQQFLPEALTRTPTREWNPSASVQVNVGLTDNPGGAQRTSGFTPYTSISPILGLTGDTSRLQVRFNYAPQAYLYAQNSSQNRVSQGLTASALGTLIKDTLFLDLRGLITEQDRFGGVASSGVAQQNGQFYNNQNTVTSSSFSATPYLVHRFAGWGTGRVGYSIARTLQSNNGNNFNNNINVLNAVPGYGVASNVTSQRERGSFVTGENFGRFNNELIVQGTQYSGGGVYRGAYNNFVANEVGYAVTRTITLLGGVGYQNIHFNGNPPYNLSEPTWNFGTRLLPNADSSLTVTYGRRDGGTQVSFIGTYSPTVRTRISGSYTTGITTSALEQQDLLQTTSVGPAGLLVDNITGAPVTANAGVGLQNAVSRIKRLTIGAFLLMERNTFSASFTNQNSTTLTSSFSVLGNGVPAGTVTTSSNASLSWQHDLNPVTNLTASVSYGVTNNAAVLGNPNAGSQNTVGLSTAVSRTFTETLSGSLGYSYTNRSGGQANQLPASLGGSTNQNLLYASLRKSF